MTEAITKAFDYLRKHNIDIPLDTYLEGVRVGAFKAGGNLAAISSRYNDAIIETIIKYFTGGSLAASRNAFKRATTEAFGAAIDLGWTDGGNQPPIDADVLAWFNARLNAEFGYIDMLFESMKALKKEDDFDYFQYAVERAAGYVGTLREIYNYAKLSSSKNIMVTFDGDDGKESCPDCQKYKGKRHRISWFMARNAVPPYGSGLQCHKGGRCEHFLRDDNGNQVTA